MSVHARPNPGVPGARRTVPVLLALGLMAIGAACRSQPAQPAVRPVLRMAVAFAPFSTRLAEEYRRTLPDLDIQDHPAASSGEVLRRIQSDELDFGIALADDAYRAYFGAEPGQATASGPVRAISLLQPLPTYLLARTGSGIHSVPDLKGKTVVVGPRNSSSWKLGTLALNAFSVDPIDIRPTASRAAAVQALKDGEIDAIMLPGYVYPEALTESLLRDGGAYLVPIEGAPIEQLRRDLPFVRVVMIPRDIYPGQDRIVPTVGIDMLIVCRRDLDEALVYRLAEQLFNVFPRIARVEATMRFLNVEEAPATPIPLHAGAARYFRERELSR